MIHNIVAENVNWALPQGIELLLKYGQEHSSRNGPVLVAPTPVCTTFTKPHQRVLFSPVRDANPFFHLMESLWMLNGDNDVAWPAFFAGNIKNYSDDGETLHGAYGHRWLRHFEINQLNYVVDELKRGNSRRAVLGMWDPAKDIDAVLGSGKDVPCNTHAYFSVEESKLNMIVCARSNDVIWGAYGANVVHFSVLQEYIAGCLGMRMGLLRQLSYNYHVYLEKYPREQLAKMALDSQGYNEYSRPLTMVPLMEKGIDVAQWHGQLARFMVEPENTYADDYLFFSQVARPMYRSWVTRKLKNGTGLAQAEKIAAGDWRIACMDWIQRREKADA